MTHLSGVDTTEEAVQLLLVDSVQLQHNQSRRDRNRLMCTGHGNGSRLTDRPRLARQPPIFATFICYMFPGPEPELRHLQLFAPEVERRPIVLVQAILALEVALPMHHIYIREWEPGEELFAAEPLAEDVTLRARTYLATATSEPRPGSTITVYADWLNTYTFRVEDSFTIEYVLLLLHRMFMLAATGVSLSAAAHPDPYDILDIRTQLGRLRVNGAVLLYVRRQ